jgi:hypothetical protein
MIRASFTLEDASMSRRIDDARRMLLKNLAAGLSLVPLAASRAADAPLLAEDDPAAKVVHYVDDAGRAKDAQPGANCANCIQYTPGPGEGRGSCKLFAGKLVKAAGWCSAWSDL